MVSDMLTYGTPVEGRFIYEYEDRERTSRGTATRKAEEHEEDEQWQRWGWLG